MAPNDYRSPFEEEDAELILNDYKKRPKIQRCLIRTKFCPHHSFCGGRSVSGRGCEKILRAPGKYIQCGQKSFTISHDRSV